MMRHAGRFGWHRLNGHRALLKDPIALFYAEWIAETFNPKIIVVMRHPAAFVNSLKRLCWEFPFQHLAAHPRLLEEQLTPFVEKIRNYAAKPHDIIDQAALLWHIFANTISSYHEKHDEGIFVRHEDVAAHPVSKFQSMYRYCDLSFKESVERVIRDHSSATNPADPTDTSTDHHLHRDSKSVT